MTSLRTLQVLGLVAVGFGIMLSVVSRRVPMRGWVGVVLLLVAAVTWACIDSENTSRPTSLPMYLSFLLLSPVAVVYSFRARRVAPDHVAAVAAFMGSFVVAVFLLFMVVGILASLFAL